MTGREQELDQLVMEQCAKACCTETARLLTEWLDRVIHGDGWARDASTREVWMMLLGEIRRMAIKAGHS